ncbi:MULTISPECIES: hypothetical protein [unclassified Luteimonas]
MPYLRHPALAGALLSAVAIAAALPSPAAAQVRRCTTPDGGAVYTDRSCESLGAVENRPRTEGSGSAAALRYRGGCSRRLQDLVFEVTAAIDAGDTNRLARSYHWVGMSHSNGYAVIERLDAIARRPLLNISALRPAEAVVASAEPAPLAALDGSAAMPATPPSPRRPVALRIDQALADGITPSSTTFGLRRHMDCWWITL